MSQKSSDAVYVNWQSLGDQKDDDGWHYVQRITVTGDTDMKGLAFNQFARTMTPLNPADTIHEIIPGYYLITSERFGKGLDSLTIDIDTRGYLVNCSYEPDGFHRVLKDNTAAPIVLSREKMTDVNIHNAFNIAKYPKAADIYTLNESMATDWRPGVYDVVPSFNSVNILPGNKTVVNPKVELLIDKKFAVEGQPELAIIEVDNGKAVVKSVNKRAARAAANVFQAKVLDVNQGKPLPAAVLEFNPAFGWRGVMIDISRNFQTPETLKGILRVMAANGLNKLHFHALDDEAWRLEIPSLPELTQVGSRRGWGLDESDHLYQLFTGDGNPDNLAGTSNGMFTREEFIDMLKYADALGIDVLTEIESPGHARAAIKAMERRAKNGDASMRLIEDNDTSKYTSAQSFHDNVMNPSLESTYKFMETVIDDIIAMYDEAGVELIGIHIGGDEVPRGAWNGSPSVKKFMAENGLETERDMHAWFVRRMAKLLAEKNVPMFGWQEIALDHGDEFNTEVAPLTGGVNTWSTQVRKGNTLIPVKSVMGGYPTILSNVDKFYFDLSYSAHPEEPGLSWGGHVDEFASFSGYADVLCPMPEDAKGKVIGVNAQIFAETMRSPQQMFMYLTPKIFGLAERSVHPDTTYTEAQFNTIIGEKELPALEKLYSEEIAGQLHMRQPGIKILEDMVYMNAPYSGGVIRYTVDGTEPDEKSPIYSGPFKKDGKNDIRAKYFRNNASSVTTYSSR